MNSGIQDASNLGWKLALASRGTASKALLDSDDAERRPAAHAVLTFTHVLFRMETADNPLSRRARAALAPLVVSLAIRHACCGPSASASWVSSGFGTLAGRAAVERSPRLRRGPRAGHRLPDASLLWGQVPAACIRP